MGEGRDSSCCCSSSSHSSSSSRRQNQQERRHTYAHVFWRMCATQHRFDFSMLACTISLPVPSLTCLPAVARLPFQPPSWLANNVTHRGLPGDDVRDCGALFLYILCTTFCKLNLAQGAPWAPSRASERAMRPQPAAYDENKNK